MPDVPDSEQPAGLPPRKKSNPSNTNRKSGMRKAKRALLMQAAADIAAKTREEASKPNGMLAVIDLPSLDDEEDETREHAYRPKPGGWVGVLPNSVPPKPPQPTLPYDPQVADDVLQFLAEGNLLSHISRYFPVTERTVRTWALKDVEGFGARYDQARSMGWDTRAENILNIAADNARDFSYDPESGRVTFNGNHVQRHRLMIDAEKWVLGKMKPDRYAERVQVDMTQKNGPGSLTTEQLAEQATSMLLNLIPAEETE